MRFVQFTLFGPMASWGEIAPGEQRGSDRFPTRSAILGLLGASLGFAKTDPRFQELCDSLLMASRTDGKGHLNIDFHTSQKIHNKAQREPRLTRKEVIQRFSDSAADMSTREYWTDLFYRILVWKTSTSGPSLEEIQGALQEPVWQGYLGRKSCPLALPMKPEIVEGTHPVEVLKTLSSPSTIPDLESFPDTESAMICWEGDPTPYAAQTVVRRDVPEPRGVWQFRNRMENQLLVPTCS